MANQITDGRSSIGAGSDADNVSNWDDLTGAAAGTLDNEIFYQGSGSIGQYITTTRDGLLYDAASAQDWSNSHFHILINCGIVGLLDTKANGGFTIRFCGATVTDWFEVFVAGSDDWPTAFSGGWTQFVVDIETARSTAVTNGWTNGTTPATTAIRYVGFSAITAATMPRMVDNTWVDQITILADGSPGILVEGQDQTGGAHDWIWDDIIAASDSGKWATCRRGPGGSVILNAPVQFGINDATTHGFSDTNQVILWDSQEYVANDFYNLSIIGGSGTQSFQAGSKIGSGDAATGNQGWVVSADSSGARWSIDADDANIDAALFYGCTFIHAEDMQLDSTSVEIRDCLLNDISSITSIGGSEFARNTIVNANTADGVALVTIDSLSDIKNNSFNFSDGHAIELTSNTGSPFTFIGNLFSGYGGIGSNDAAIYNNSGGAVTINVSGGGDSPTYRNGSGASTTVNNTVTHTLTGVINDSEVTYMRKVHDKTDLAIANASGTSADLTSTTTDLSFIESGQDVMLFGFSNAGNNGEWTATANGTATSVALSKLSGSNPVNETAGNSVDLEVEVFHVENVTGNQTDYSYNFESGVIVRIQVLKEDFVYLQIDDLTLPSTDTELPIQQTSDVNYSNPV